MSAQWSGEVERQREMIYSGEENALIELAEKVSLDPSLQVALAHRKTSANQWLASRADLTLEAQQVLATCTDSWVRCFLAENVAIDLEVQAMLAEDRVERVRSGVAGHTTSVELQRALSCDVASVRESLRLNPDLQLDEEFSLCFWSMVQTRGMERVLQSAGVAEEWRSLVDEWEGSLSSFLEAHGLLVSSPGL